MRVNIIVENLLSQVHEEFNIFMIIYKVINHRVGPNTVTIIDSHYYTNNGFNQCKSKSHGWEVCLKWKYGSIYCNVMKYIKDSYPV